MAISLKPEIIAFIDESGDFELSNVDVRFPICAQCALTSTVDDYLSGAVPDLMKIKYHFFGNETVVVHGHKIRRRSGPFAILQDENIRNEFMDALCWAIGNLKGNLIVAVVDKAKLKGQYVSPTNPFFLTLQFLLERLYLYWQGSLFGGRRLLCVFEKRGAKEDAQTLEWFEEICGGNNYRHRAFPFDADFREKSENVVGHQFADLVAYSACRFVESGDGARLDWITVKEKLFQVDGKLQGNGLKVFP
eukprot:gene18462-18737_t